MEIPDLALFGVIIGLLIGWGSYWFAQYFSKLRRIASGKEKPTKD